MEYLRGKLRGKTPSWGRGSEGSGYERRGSGDSRSSPFWGRRDSGGSLSSLWSRSSKSQKDAYSDWKPSEDRGSSALLGRKTSQSDYNTYRSYRASPSPASTPTIGRSSLYSPTQTPTTNDSSWRIGRSSASSALSAQTPTNDHPWRVGCRVSQSPVPVDKTGIAHRLALAPQSPAPPCRPPPPTTQGYPWSHDRASQSPPSPPPPPPMSDSSYYSDVDENLNYKTLFEREKQEKELYGAKLAEMEQQQQMLESNLKKFLDLKKELRSFQREAEESDRVVNDFIKAVVPDFTTKKRQKKPEPEEDEERKRKVTKSQGKPPLPNPANQNNILYRANLVQADPDLPSSPSPPGPPLPTVKYEWDDAYTSPTPANPVGRYSYSTTSRCPSRLDELKLNLVFDVNSRQLPTKLQLEIKDKKGRVVFKKRQNLYYVKVQERLSTLDAEDDYIMTVTSICGPSTTCEEVPIHNKYYSPPETEETEPFTISESMTLPVMETCRSPSEASFTSGFDERSIDSIFDTPLRNMEATYDEICREVSSPLPRYDETPLPDLEEIVEVEFAPAVAKVEVIPALDNHEIEPESVLLEKKNPFLLLKKPIIPEVLYKWQRGFRRGPGSQYRKVPILKLTFKYEESQALLPSELEISCANDFKRVNVSQKLANAEFVVAEGQNVTLSVISKDRTGQDDLTAPPFTLCPENIADSLLGDWHILQPALTIDLS
eukprot:GFUD01004309.1.p1 GENE.GFUD01004309.1~~GFUD01004309.1.p1  ORF type:complete len:715 (+),score=200.07 GFUD01004309.1:151-2295(+)